LKKFILNVMAQHDNALQLIKNKMKVYLSRVFRNIETSVICFLIIDYKDNTKEY
jgi:hypothetical protein